MHHQAFMLAEYRPLNAGLLLQALLQCPEQGIGNLRSLDLSLWMQSF